MKSIKIFCCCMLMSFSVNAQQIENANFDSVYIGGIDRIHAWITSDVWPSGPNGMVMPLNPDSHHVGVGLMFHETYHTVQIEYSGAFDGQYAIKMISDSALRRNDGSHYDGFIVNGNHFYTDSAGYIDFKKGGTPFAYRPAKLKGHFKFDSQSPSLNSYGKATVLLKKYNPSLNQSDTIGFAETTTQLYMTTSWSPFELPINYLSSLIPDSIVVVFTAPNTGYNATLWMDSIGFDYSSTSGITDSKKENDQLFYLYHPDQKIYFSEKGALLDMQLYDVNGRLVMKRSLAGHSLDISAFKKGVYFLVFNDTKRGKKVFKLLF